MNFWNPLFGEKPYGVGHRVVDFPITPTHPAVLDMPLSHLPDMTRIPTRMSLHLAIEPVVYEGAAYCEVIKDGVSLGQTPLYSRGFVQEGASRMLKRHGRHQSVRLKYMGQGFVYDAHERWVPFYADSPMTRLLGMAPDTILFEKTFEVMRRPFTQHLRRGEKNELVYYPYGGYLPERGSIDRMEPLVCQAVATQMGEREVTALRVEPLSELRDRGIEPGRGMTTHDTRYRIHGWEEGVRCTSLGEDLREGHLNFMVKGPHDENVRFLSEGYEERRGSETSLWVSCGRA
jgi:hypothetical protein